MVTCVEKGLLSEVVFYGDSRIVIDEIGSSVSVLLLFCGLLNDSVLTPI